MPKSETDTIKMDTGTVYKLNNGIDKSDSPVGRLKVHLPMWKKATDSRYILDVIEQGYKLPFKTIPENSEIKNNKSARDNPVFVEKEIESLIEKGIVSKVYSKPCIVNPLTVAYNKKGKPRLVLDCRYINPFLHQFKVKFEDITIAEALFDLIHFFSLTI
jgi:hypothetical protein